MKTKVKDVSTIEGGVSAQSIMFIGCLKTARKHAISAQLINLKLMVSFF